MANICRITTKATTSPPCVFDKQLMMESREVFPFLALPAELHNHIYHYINLDWNNVNSCTKEIYSRRCDIRRYQRSSNRDHNHDSEESCRNGSCELRKLFDDTIPQRSTPSILLVNKQITAELIGTLHTKPLILYWPLVSDECHDLIPITRLISAATLLKVQDLEIVLKREHSRRFHFDKELLDIHAVLAGFDSYISPNQKRERVGSDVPWVSKPESYEGDLNSLRVRYEVLNGSRSQEKCVFYQKFFEQFVKTEFTCVGVARSELDDSFKRKLGRRKRPAH
ncbi:hypothetical protein EJ08DRAFT_699175 [Tothia fuscella]|uniref:F-box domain-containing protein n=1 Tax=Tothia fuscella TaxID=1048955 RepID=A0A9P4TX66_9PEZI|nr:hypothetical protein EJ08DRAFT_699175 [Tothia fuscella]